MQQRHERKYRDIRPAKLPVERADSNDNKSFVASPAETSSQPRRKRSAVAVACDRCRARKVACDGGAPSCNACSRQGKTDCHYTPKAQKLPEGVTLSTIDKLKSENVYLRRRLREAERLLALSPGTGLARAGPTSEVLKGPEHHVRSVLPPCQTSLEFEIMARQPVSYPTLGPMEAGQTSLGMIFHPDMALWQSLHTDSAPGTSNTNQKSSVPENEASRTTASNAAGTGTEFLWDKRLHNVNISRWTEVAVSNEFAAKAMSLYLQTDHPLFGLFDADLFLNDLTSGQLNFCSPLLVNALLCWACQAYANFQPEATGLCQRFYLIAKQQWQSNKVHTITAVAASMFLSIAATCLGDDELSAQFLQEGCVMGKSLGLFGASDAGSAKQ